MSTSKALWAIAAGWGITLAAGAGFFHVYVAPLQGGSPPQRAVLDKYCVTCHNERLHTAGLMLDKMNVEDVGKSAEVWERVLSKLESREMPPPGMPRPDWSTLDARRAYRRPVTEDFDGLGRWRDRDAGKPIDASGVLPDGTGLDGLAGLKRALLARPEQFVGTRPATPRCTLRLVRGPTESFSYS